MSYKYTKSYKDGIDIIIPTKKGLEEGDMPKGIIIPICYSRLPELQPYLKLNTYNIYTVKHCEQFNIMTHIVPSGMVNRFGLYITKAQILSVKKDWNINIETGWFKRITIQDIKKIENYM